MLFSMTPHNANIFNGIRKRYLFEFVSKIDHRLDDVGPWFMCIYCRWLITNIRIISNQRCFICSFFVFVFVEQFDSGTLETSEVIIELSENELDLITQCETKEWNIYYSIRPQDYSFSIFNIRFLSFKSQLFKYLIPQISSWVYSFLFVCLWYSVLFSFLSLSCALYFHSFNSRRSLSICQRIFIFNYFHHWLTEPKSFPFTANICNLFTQ